MDKINHLVFLMMENRSFDHYLGALNLDQSYGAHVEGLGGATPGNQSATSETQFRPLPLEGLKIDKNSMRDPPHESPEVLKQLNGGKMDGFVRAYQEYYPHSGQDRGYPDDDEAKLVMGYYTRKTLPVLYALADEFAVCDHWFSSIAGSTWPNRLFALAGSCGNMFTTGDLRRFGAYRYPAPAVRRWGISWKAYTARPGQMSVFDLWTGPVYFSAHGGTLEDFAKDCGARRLPSLSYVEPNYSTNDDHWPHDPARGQQFIGSIARTLIASPSWEDSALVITYDEHGGLFDHVQPPRAPEGSTDARLFLLGCRVPAIVASPYTPRRAVVSTTFDHTSFLKTVAERWGLEPPPPRASHPQTASLWNTGCFDFSRGPRGRGEVLPALESAIAQQQGLNRQPAWAATLDEPVTDLESAFRNLSKMRELGHTHPRK